MTEIHDPLADRDPTPPDTPGQKLCDAIAALIASHRRRNHEITAYDNASLRVRRALREADVELPLVYGGYVFRFDEEADEIVAEKASVME